MRRPLLGRPAGVAAGHTLERRRASCWRCSPGRGRSGAASFAAGQDTESPDFGRRRASSGVRLWLADAAAPIWLLPSGGRHYSMATTGGSASIPMCIAARPTNPAWSWGSIAAGPAAASPIASRRRNAGNPRLSPGARAGTSVYVESHRPVRLLDGDKRVAEGDGPERPTGGIGNMPGGSISRSRCAMCRRGSACRGAASTI